MKDQLLGRLTIGLKPYGFEFHKKDQAFRKTTESGRWSVRVGVIKHKSDFDVVMSVSVRIDALERLIHEDDPDLGEKSYSLGAEIGNIKDGKQKRWSVSNAEELDSSCASMIEILGSVGIPYLQRYMALEAALAALSGDDGQAWLHSPVDGERAKRALGLAFLLGDADAFQRLAESKVKFLKSRSDPSLEDFVVFKVKLESRLRSS